MTPERKQAINRTWKANRRLAASWDWNARPGLRLYVEPEVSVCPIAPSGELPSPSFETITITRGYRASADGEGVEGFLECEGLILEQWREK